ncbi:ZIP family metal transporter [Sulfodiicoccus acidiphilus]|nr:hypothetical protein [Sulfodiicoccus acidiphilus]
MMINKDVEVIGLATVVGFSIFATFPLTRHTNLDQRKVELLNGAAMGVLIYLLMDVFSGTYLLVGESDPLPETILLLGIVLSYLGFHLLSSVRPRRVGQAYQSAQHVSTLIALGIGLQNLTEGLALGGSFRLGLSSIVLPLVVGSTLQNVTEGFPISAPFLTERQKPAAKTVGGLYLLGGAPTLIGAIFSYLAASTILVASFNGIALGSIIYVLMEMYRGTVKRTQHLGLSPHLTSVGLVLGFTVAFLVNMFP